MPRRENSREAQSDPSRGVADIPNSALRKEMIQKAAIALEHLDKERAGLKLQIKAINEDRKEIYERLTNDLGVDRKTMEFVINHLVRPEEPIRDAIHDCLREVWEALRPGEQLDWLTGLSEAVERKS